MKTNKRIILILIICVLIGVGVLYCPKKLFTPSEYLHEGMTQTEKEGVHDKIDTSHFEPSDDYVIPDGSLRLADAPGMVFYTYCIHGETKLSYINKSTGNAFIFCFDPKCSHYNCIADKLGSVKEMFYCNNRLYLVIPDSDENSGDKLLSVGLDAADLKVCYTDGGSKISRLLVYGEKILFTRDEIDKGSVVIAYDTVTGESSAVGENIKSEISLYFSVSDRIYYQLKGDTYICCTDDCFETSERLFDAVGIPNIMYGDSEYIYGIDNEGQAILRFSLETGVTDKIFTRGPFPPPVIPVL